LKDNFCPIREVSIELKDPSLSAAQKNQLKALGDKTQSIFPCDVEGLRSETGSKKNVETNGKASGCANYLGQRGVSRESASRAREVLESQRALPVKREIGKENNSKSGNSREKASQDRKKKKDPPAGLKFVEGVGDLLENRH